MLFSRAALSRAGQSGGDVLLVDAAVSGSTWYFFFFTPPPPFLTTATVFLVPKQSPYPAQPEHGSERGIAREMSLVEKAWVVVVVDKHTRG